MAFGILPYQWLPQRNISIIISTIVINIVIMIIGIAIRIIIIIKIILSIIVVTVIIGIVALGISIIMFAITSIIFFTVNLQPGLGRKVRRNQGGPRDAEEAPEEEVQEEGGLQDVAPHHSRVHRVRESRSRTAPAVRLMQIV